MHWNVRIGTALCRNRICVLCNHTNGIHHVTYIETSAGLVVEQAHVDEAQYLAWRAINFGTLKVWTKIHELILNLEEDENIPLLSLHIASARVLLCARIVAPVLRSTMREM